MRLRCVNTDSRRISDEFW